MFKINSCLFLLISLICLFAIDQVQAVPCGFTVTSATGNGVPLTSLDLTGNASSCDSALEVRATCDPSAGLWTQWQFANVFGGTWSLSLNQSTLKGLGCKCGSRVYVNARCQGEFCDEEPDLSIECPDPEPDCPNFSCSISSENLQCGTAPCAAGKTPVTLTPTCSGLNPVDNPQYMWNYDDGNTTFPPNSGVPTPDTHCYDQADIPEDGNINVVLTAQSGGANCPWQSFNLNTNVNDCSGGSPGCPTINCTVNINNLGCVNGEQSVELKPTCSNLDPSASYQHWWTAEGAIISNVENSQPVNYPYVYSEKPASGKLTVQAIVNNSICEPPTEIPLPPFPEVECPEDTCSELTNLTATYEVPPTVAPGSIHTIAIGSEDCVPHYLLPATVQVVVNPPATGTLTFKFEKVGSVPAVIITKIATLPKNSVEITNADFDLGASYNVSVTLSTDNEDCQPQVGGTLHICDNDSIKCPEITGVGADTNCIHPNTDSSTSVEFNVSGTNLEGADIDWDLGDGNTGSGLPIPPHDYAGGSEVEINVSANKQGCGPSILGIKLSLCSIADPDSGGPNGGNGEDGGFCGGEWWCCLLWALMMIFFVATLIALAWALCVPADPAPWVVFGVALVLTIAAAVLFGLLCDGTACAILTSLLLGGLGGGLIICSTNLIPCTSVFCNIVTFPGSSFGVAGWVIVELGLGVIVLLVCLFT